MHKILSFVSISVSCLQIVNICTDLTYIDTRSHPFICIILRLFDHHYIFSVSVFLIFLNMTCIYFLFVCLFFFFLTVEDNHSKYLWYILLTLPRTALTCVGVFIRLNKSNQVDLALFKSIDVSLFRRTCPSFVIHFFIIENVCN